MKFTPLIYPNFNLSGLVDNDVLTQTEVNDAEGQSKEPYAKFASVLDVCFDWLEDVAWSHLTLAFYYELPAQVDLKVRQVGLSLKLTSELDGFMVRGVMSGSFRDWRNFLRATAVSKDKDIEQLGEWLRSNIFGKYKYFN